MGTLNGTLLSFRISNLICKRPFLFLLLSLLQFIRTRSAGVSLSFTDDNDHLQDGVRVIRPVYATIPYTRNGLQNVTVVMTIWLKRVGATRRPYDMPHQSQDAIRMMVWVDNPTNLFQRTNGHLLLPTDHAAWAPTLSLETASPGPVLPVVLEPTPRTYRRVWGVGQRPYSYRVDLSAGIGDCFKIIEASFPMHKNTFCLPPAAQENLCSMLAPASVYTSRRPALYTVVGPIRHPKSTRDWESYYTQVSGRLINYVSYHVAMGLSGLILYADDMMRMYFRRNPQLGAMMKKGHLRLIAWDLQERSHNDTDGVGRPLGYNYDQGLVGSHSQLALSSCGANLLIVNVDLDEYLYFSRSGRKWPTPWGRCMGGALGSLTDPVAVHRLWRFETISTEVHPDDEPALWTVPGTLDARVAITGDGSSGNGTIYTIASSNTAGSSSRSSNSSSSSSNSSNSSSRSGGSSNNVTTMPPHPMARYNVVHARPLPKNQVKQLSMPGANVVLFWVHEGPSMYGRTLLLHQKCVSILHISNAFRGRRQTGLNVAAREGDLRFFRHWMFLEPNSNVSSALWEL